MIEALKANEWNQKKDSELPVGSILRHAHNLIMLLLFGRILRQHYAQSPVENKIPECHCDDLCETCQKLVEMLFKNLHIIHWILDFSQ